MEFGTNSSHFKKGSADDVNRRIIDILRMPTEGLKMVNQLWDMKLSELKALLQDASVDISGCNHAAAALKYKAALNLAVEIPIQDENLNRIIMRYMLCVTLIESDRLKDLVESVQNLITMEKCIGSHFPAVYHALGKAHYKLYRFMLAHDAIEKGFAFLNKEDIVFQEYCIPGTNCVISETTREGLSAALIKLRDECSSWPHPDAVCCSNDCLNRSQHYAPSRDIFFSDPAFNGMVIVTCSNIAHPCILKYHLACWKLVKEQLFSTKELSDKDVIGYKCLTLNCETYDKVPFVITKVEIIGEDAEVKTHVKASIDPIIWPVQHPLPKGAIGKHIKSRRRLKEPRKLFMTSTSTVHPSPPDNDALYDDETEKQCRLVKLVTLRENNFGMSIDTDWRPDREMYGNQYMIKIAESIPGPNFINDSTYASTFKTFIFSLFYEYIKSIGPVKVKEVTKKWEETKSLLENYDNVLNDITDISEFLLLSHKIVAVGDYLCVPQILPEAWNLVKNDATGCLRFLMENLLEPEESDVEMDDDDLLNQMLIDECGENVFKIMEYDNNEMLATCDNMWTTCTNLETANSVDLRDINSSDMLKANQQCETSGTNGNSPKQRDLDNKSYSKELEHDAVLNSLEYNEKDNCLLIEATQLDKSFQSSNVVDHKSCYERVDRCNDLHDDEKVENVIRKDMEKAPERTNDYTFHCDELHLNNKPHSVLLNTTTSEESSMKLKFYDVQDFEETEVNSKGYERVTKVGSDIKCKDTINLQSNNDDCQDSQIESDIDFERLMIDQSAHLLSTMKANCHDDSFIEEQKRNFVSQYLINKINQDFKNSYGLEADINNQKLQDPVVNYLLSDQTDSNVVSEICANLFFGKDDNKLELQKNTPKETDVEETYEQLKRDFSQLKQYTAKLEQEKNDAEYDLKLLLEDKYNITRMFDAKREELENELKVCRTHLENKTAELEALQCKEEHMERTMLKKCLDYQFVSNRILLTAYMEKCQNTLDILKKLQDIVIKTTGYNLYPNGGDLDWQMAFNRVQKASSDYQTKFISVMKLLESKDKLENMDSINLNLVDILLPRTNILEFIESAFAAYHIHFTRIVQMIRCSVPSPIPLLPMFPPNSQMPNAHLPFGYGFQYNNQNMPFKHTQQNAQPRVSDCTDKSNAEYVHPMTQEIDRNKNYDHHDFHHEDNNDDNNNNNDNKEKNVDDEYKATTISGAKRFVNKTEIVEENEDVNERINSNDETPLAIGSNDDPVNSRQTKPSKRTEICSDKLMQQLRMRHSGVLESDLLESVEDVRRMHNNSLSEMRISEVINEAELFIMRRQEKQLCKYSASVQVKPPSVPSMPIHKHNQNHPTSSLTSSASSVKKCTPVPTQRKNAWGPVCPTRDTWKKESVELECNICIEPMETMSKANPIYTLRCQHSFHKSCIQNWFCHNHSCPTCRVHCTMDDEFPPLQ